MAIVIENTYTDTHKKASSVTISSVVVPTSSDRAIYVFAGGQTKNDADAKFISGITFNGSENFVKVGTGEAQNAKATVSIWRLIAPTETTADVVVTFDDNNATWNGGHVVVHVLNGVDQSTPDDGWTVNQGLSTTPSVTSNTTTSTDLVVDTLGAGDAVQTAVPVETGEATTTDFADITNTKHGAGVAHETGDGTTMVNAWVLTTNTSWSNAITAIKEAAGGPITYDYTRLSNTAIQRLGYDDKTQLSISAIKRLGYADIQLLSDTLIVNSFTIEPLSDTRIKAEGTDYTRPSISAIQRLEFDDKSQLSDVQIKREAIQDYTLLSDVRIKLEASDDYTRPSDTTISLTTDYTRLSDLRILNTTDYTLLSNTQIAGGGKIDLDSIAAIKVGGFADVTQLADTRIKIEESDDYTRLSDIRILKATDLTLLSDVRIEVTDEVTELSDTRIQTLAQEETQLSITAIKREDFADVQLTSVTTIGALGTVDHQEVSDTRIKVEENETSKLSDTTIVIRTDIQLTTDTRIVAITDNMLVSDARIKAADNELTLLSDIRIVFNTDLTLTSFTRVRSEMPLLDTLSSTRIKVLEQSIDLTSDTKIILSSDITTLSDIRIKSAQELFILSGTKISTSLEGLKIELSSGTYIRLADLNITDIKAKFIKIHGIKASTRRVIIE